MPHCWKSHVTAHFDFFLASSDQAYGGRFVAASQSKIDKQFGTEGQFKGGNQPLIN